MSARLGRDERFEQMREHLRRDAGATVGDREQSRGRARPARRASMAMHARFAIGDGIERIAEQVDDHLLQLARLGAHRRAGRDVDVELHVFVANARFVDQHAHARPPRRATPAPRSTSGLRAKVFSSP